MQAGLLRDTIEIQKRIIDKDDFGSDVETFQHYLSTKAQVIYSSGKRNISNNEITYNYNVTFVIRYCVDISESMRINFDEKYYRILSIEPDRHFNKKIVITELINE
jgi:SPP1 family predicted phage head-tail adaptor